MGVAPGALYWHIASKQELIACMGEAIVQQLLDGPLPDPARLSADGAGRPMASPIQRAVAIRASRS